MAKGLEEWELQWLEVEKTVKLSITISQVNFRAYRNNRGDSAAILHICGKHRNHLYKECWEGEKGCKCKVSFCLMSMTTLIKFSFYAHFGIWEERRWLLYTQVWLSAPMSNFLPRANPGACSEGCTGRLGDAKLLGVKQNQVPEPSLFGPGFATGPTPLSKTYLVSIRWKMK